MWKKGPPVLLISLLILATWNFGSIDGQNEHYLEINQFTYDHELIRILIHTPHNESWWNPDFINSTFRAVNQWNSAIQRFASNYSEFAYLSRLKLIPIDSNFTYPNYDVYVSWCPYACNRTGDQIALTTLIPDNSRIIQNSTINLATISETGYRLDETDIQNAFVHEIGHALALRHSNYEGDLMYGTYTLGSSAKEISTLDLYAVAIIFEWLSNSVQLRPVIRWLQTSSVTLPTGIEYQYYSIQEKNLPPPSPPWTQILIPLYAIVQFILRPEVLISIIAIIAVLAFFLIQGKRRPGKNG